MRAFVPCIVQDASDQGCNAEISGLRSPHVILRTDSARFRSLVGLGPTSKVADFAIIVHMPCSIVVLEMKGRSYDVAEALIQIQNVVNALVARLPGSRIFPAVFSRSDDPITEKMWSARRIVVGSRSIPVQTRACGERVASLHGRLS